MEIDNHRKFIYVQPIDYAGRYVNAELLEAFTYYQGRKLSRMIYNHYEMYDAHSVAIKKYINSISNISSLPYSASEIYDIIDRMGLPLKEHHAMAHAHYIWYIQSCKEENRRPLRTILDFLINEHVNHFGKYPEKTKTLRPLSSVYKSAPLKYSAGLLRTEPSLHFDATNMRSSCGINAPCNNETVETLRGGVDFGTGGSVTVISEYFRSNSSYYRISHFSDSFELLARAEKAIDIIKSTLR
jgi:hypothetical protein